VEIRIVSADSGAAKPAGRGGSAAKDAKADGPDKGGVAAAVAAPPAALDQKGTRRAQRFKIIEGIEVLIDGNPRCSWTSPRWARR
jgi:hypothetical protein